jgi:hypothetical protein
MAGQVRDGFDDDEDAATDEDGRFAESAEVLGPPVPVMMVGVRISRAISSG